MAEDLSWGLSVLVTIPLMLSLLPACAATSLADRVRGALCRTR